MMTRLTKNNFAELPPWRLCGQANYCLHNINDDGGCVNGCIITKLYALLAAYEDTGLSPVEIKDLQLEVAALKTIEAMYDGLGKTDHLRELVQAEAEGRLVVLPCKKGDEIWSYVFNPKDDIQGVFSLSVKHVIVLDGRIFIKTGFHGEHDAEEIGKTLFHTREEAEAELQKRRKRDGTTGT